MPNFNPSNYTDVINRAVIYTGTILPWVSYARARLQITVLFSMKLLSSCHYLITYYSRYQSGMCIVKSLPIFEPFYPLVICSLAHWTVTPPKISLLFTCQDCRNFMITDRCPSWKHNVYISAMLKVPHCCHSQNNIVILLAYVRRLLLLISTVLFGGASVFRVKVFPAWRWSHYAHVYLRRLRRLQHIYCHVYGVPWRIITDSGLDDWIYWHCYYYHSQLQPIIAAYNRRLSKTRSIPSWTTSVFSSTVTDLVLIY
jgi:hypothetical protein